MNNLQPDNLRILEGIMTTLKPEPREADMLERLNIAPMGPLVDERMQEMILRPFTGSRTYQNLKASGEGVFHVTDDVLLLARATIGPMTAEQAGPMRPAEHIRGLILADACRYYELKVLEIDDRQERATVRTAVVGSCRLRDFFGFNRGKHAVVEAAILVSRIHLTGVESVLREMEKLRILVDKTGAAQEQQAMRELSAYVKAHQGVETKP